MTRWRPYLSALFLLSPPAGAQVVRLPAAAAPLAAPAASVSAALAASAAPSLLAPAPAFSVVAAPSLSAAAPALAAAAPAAFAVPADAAAPAFAAAPAALPAISALPAAAADAPKSNLPGAEPADLPSRLLFDGGASAATRSGSVFNLVWGDPGKIPGGVSFVRVKDAPAAPARQVPRTSGLYGRDLLSRVGEIAAQNHVARTRYESSRYLFSTADNHVLRGVPGIADAYSGVFVPGNGDDGREYTNEGEDGSPRPDGRAQVMNVEHVFPQTYFKRELPMVGDLHILMATLDLPNEMRGSLPFGVVKGARDYENKAGAKRGGGVFEPPDFTKGRVARAMLYFYARYKGQEFFDARTDARTARFWNAQIETMLDWNRRFPPSVEERRRNDHVESFQGNRNPFVDDPSLADKIGAESWRAFVPRKAAAAPAAPLTRAERKAAKKAARRSDKKRKGKPRQFFRRPRRSRYSGR